MGLISPDAFEALWKAVQEPYIRLRDKVQRLEARPSRAETAGAVLVVDTLPDYGEKGRILYLESGDGNEGFWGDIGTAWVKLH